MLNKYENLESFPNEILFMIASYLEPKDLLQFCRANKRTRDIIMTKNFWIYKLEKEYNITYPKEPVMFIPRCYYKIINKKYDEITSTFNKLVSKIGIDSISCLEACRTLHANKPGIVIIARGKNQKENIIWKSEGTEKYYPTMLVEFLADYIRKKYKKEVIKSYHSFDISKILIDYLDS